MLKENEKESGEKQAGTEEKQSGEASKVEEVPVAVPVAEAEGEKKEGEKEVKSETKDVSEKPQQPEQEPGDVTPKPTPSPVHAPTGEEDLEKGAATTTAEEEKSQEKKVEPKSKEPKVSELGASALEFMQKNGGWGLLVTFASFILLIQASVLLSQPSLRFRFFLSVASTQNANITKYAVAYAVITFCAALTFAMVMKFKGVPEKPRQLFIVLLFLWVTIGTGILTFRGPFFLLSNGYFAAWTMLFGCYMMLKEEVKEASQYVENFSTNAGYVTLLGVFSLVEFFSALAICTISTVCSDLSIYAIVVGLVSAIVCIVLGVVSGLSSLIRKIAFCSLLLWWFVAMCALTFPWNGPFLLASNGFFSLWISLVLSAALTFLEFREQPLVT